MKIGFLLYYKDDDDTHLALSVADALSELGSFDISIGTFAIRRNKVRPAWDNKITFVLPEMSSRWVRDKDCLISTYCLPMLEAVKSAKRPRLVRILQCDTLGEFDKKNEKKYRPDVYVCPSSIFTELLKQKTKLTNIRHILWHSGLPCTVKSSIHSPIRVLVPLYGDNARRSSTNIVPLIVQLIRTNPHVSVGLLYSRTSAPGSRRIVDRLVKDYNRVIPYFCKNWEERLVTFSNHDLSLLPYAVDGAGLAVMESLSMGTPCIAFDASPIREYVHPDQNSILVPTKYKTDRLGMPVVSANYNALKKYTQALLNDPNRIEELMRNTSLGDEDRKESFVGNWLETLTDRGA